MTTATAFSVPGSSLGWWHERFKELQIDTDAPTTRDQEEVLTFRDPDGMVIDLVASEGDHRSGWDGVADIPAEHAVRGLHAITLSERQLDPSATMLTDLLGMSLTGEEGERSRFGMAGGSSGALVDVFAGVRDRGWQAGGTVHHVAFRRLPLEHWQYGNGLGRRSLEEQRNGRGRHLHDIDAKRRAHLGTGQVIQTLPWTRRAHVEHSGQVARRQTPKGTRRTAHAHIDHRWRLADELELCRDVGVFKRDAQHALDRLLAGHDQPEQRREYDGDDLEREILKEPDSHQAILLRASR
jgi:hypothetical protein